MNNKKKSFADRAMVGRAIRDSLGKLAPRQQVNNPVMFLVYISAILTTVLFALSLAGVSDGLAGSGFILAIAVILWLTCLFSNFAEALPRGVARLRRTPCGPPSGM